MRIPTNMPINTMEVAKLPTSSEVRARLSNLFLFFSDKAFLAILSFAFLLALAFFSLSCLGGLASNAFNLFLGYGRPVFGFIGLRQLDVTFAFSFALASASA